MTIYMGWSTTPLDDKVAPSLRSAACFVSFRPHARDNAYVYVEIAQPKTWCIGFDVAVKECIDYISQFLPVRVLRYPKITRSGTSSYETMYHDNNAESIVIEVAYTDETPQDMLFFVLNHIRFISQEFYTNGIRFTAGPEDDRFYPVIPERTEDTEITSYRMYLDNILYATPASSNHCPVRYGGAFRNEGLSRAEVLEYWFDGPLLWNGPPIKSFIGFMSLSEDEITKQLRLRKETTKE